MTRLSMTKAMFVIALGAVLSGCIMDTSDVNINSSKSATDTAAAGSTEPTSSAEQAAKPVKVANGSPLGGYLDQFMDANDRSKLTRALDGSLGKASRWTNPVSGAQFAVTPVSKVSMGSNICRTYQVSMIKTGIADKVSGTACIGEDGIWHAAG